MKLKRQKPLQIKTVPKNDFTVLFQKHHFFEEEKMKNLLKSIDYKQRKTED